jgi:endonuclease/exonuclease/phosphatase family metal-dependent hydrolase
MTQHNWARPLLIILGLAALQGCSSGPSRAALAPPTILNSQHLIEGTAPTATAPVAFGTYNLHWLEDPSGVRADLSRLDFVSVWAFQEARSSPADRACGSPARVVDVLPPGAWYVAWVPLNRLTEIHSDDDEGQVIASRYPIRSAELWALKTYGEKRRIALAAMLDVDGKPVRFVDTDHEPSIVSLVRGNVRETESLVAQLDQHRDDIPTLVGGDFNTSGCLVRLVSGGNDCADLRKRMAAAGFQQTMIRKVDCRTYRSAIYSGTLDHLFVRGAWALDSGADERATGSDHLPVWCRVDVQRRGAGVSAALPAGGTSAVAGIMKPTR